MKNVFLFVPLTALLLAACGGTATPDPVIPAPVSMPAPAPAPAGLTTINGSVQNYSGGASTIKLLANGDYTLAESSTNPALGSAPLSAAGVFSLALPPLAVITPYLSETGSGPAPSANCSSSVTVSDPTSQGYRFADLQYLISVSPKPSELLFCRARQQNPMLIKLLSLVSLET